MCSQTVKDLNNKCSVSDDADSGHFDKVNPILDTQVKENGTRSNAQHHLLSIEVNAKGGMTDRNTFD